jgi:hypothetical protein
MVIMSKTTSKKATDWQGKKPPTKGQNLFIKMVRALPVVKKGQK